MPPLWQRGRGIWTLAAGLIAGLCLLVPPLLAGAKAPSAPARDQYAGAKLLLEDLRAVPSFELGPKQYQLVIEALRRAYESGPAGPHRQHSLLSIARLYEEMAEKFGNASHRDQALQAYHFLLTEFPETSSRSAVVKSIRGLGAEPPARPLKAGLNKSGENGGANSARLTPARLDANKIRSGAIPLAPGRTSSGNSREARLRQVRYWSHPEYTRVIIELNRSVKYKYDRVQSPERLYFDFSGTRLDTALKHESLLALNDSIVQSIRIGQNRRNVARVVFDLTSRAPFSVSWLSNPPRLVVELRTKEREVLARGGNPDGNREPARSALSFAEALRGLRADAARASRPSSQGEHTGSPAEAARPLSPEQPEAAPPAVMARFDPNIRPPGVTSELIPPPWAEDGGPALGEAVTAEAELAPRVFDRYEPRFVEHSPPSQRAIEPPNWRPAVDASDEQPSGTIEVRQVADALWQSRLENLPRPVAEELPVLAKLSPPPPTALAPADVQFEPPKPAKATSRGKRNLIRALGLKVGRVVIDAGHGGRHTGSIGPTGLQEKNLVHDVAQRLGVLIEQGLGAEVIYTRTEDRFVPLAQRTRIANERKADLFISIHANSARQRGVRGVETYYLNFTTDSWAMAVASRENAAANRSIHELQDLLSKIAMREKIDESREFAANVQTSLHRGLAKETRGLRNRGVRKAPFVVLIGAKMPAILVEIGFISNPGDEKLLKASAHRQKVAEYIYGGLAKYADTLSSFQVSEKKAKSTGDD